MILISKKNSLREQELNSPAELDQAMAGPGARSERVTREHTLVVTDPKLSAITSMSQSPRVVAPNVG